MTITTPSDIRLTADQGIRPEPGDPLGSQADSLRDAGSSLEQVLRTTIYVVADERPDLVRVWKVIEEAFGTPSPPSTLVGVALLGYADRLVEIEAVALAGSPRSMSSIR